MVWLRQTPWYAEGNRNRVLIAGTVALLIAALIDKFLTPIFGLGVLYFFPIMLLSAFLARWQIVLLACLGAVLREVFWPFSTGAERWPRIAFAFLVFAFVGLFVSETVAYRRAARQHVAELERQIALRHRAEEELQVLINSSPAGIMTISSEGQIVMSNEAAHQIFGVGPGGLTGKPISEFLPLLGQVQRSQSPFTYRTALECRGTRASGEAFLAHIWLSTFTNTAGPAMAAIILDASEDLRDREESGLGQLLAGSRIMVGAVAHEIRNFVGAISVVHSNLGRFPGLQGSDDFKALGTLVEGLRAVASSNIFLASEPAEGVDIAAVLETFRIVIGAAAREAECEVSYNLSPSLPRVHGRAERLLQVLLNLASNSFRALASAPEKRLRISVSGDGSGGIAVRFEDSGPGVADPDQLFRPLQQGASNSGLGLYVSRAIVRSFGGDLRYEPKPGGACFIIDLVPAKSIPAAVHTTSSV